MTLNSNITLSKLKRRLLKHVWIARAGVILGILAGACVFVLMLALIFRTIGAGKYYTLARNFVFPAQSSLKVIDGKVNILIMGKGGAGHDAPDLTDTMVFVSINTKNKTITSISIPRDIWIAEMRAKINSAYYYGNQKSEGGGLVLSKSVVERVVGEPVAYAAVIDFMAFKDIVDALGGVSVTVERGFTDNFYPIAGRENDPCDGDPLYKCRYETITFSPGTYVMNGDTALKFVRSRRAEGDEGTDIAREARQQKVITGIKEKLLDPAVYLDVKKVEALVKVVETYVETDIVPEDAAAIAGFGFGARESIKSEVLPGALLVNPPISRTYDNQYVFIPLGGNWNQVHEWVNERTN